MRVVRVHWVDSSSGGSAWKTRDEVADICKSGPCQIRSVGYELHAPTKKEPWLVIAMDWNYTPDTETGRFSQHHSTMTVPKCAITKLEYLSK